MGYDKPSDDQHSVVYKIAKYNISLPTDADSLSLSIVVVCYTLIACIPGPRMWTNVTRRLLHDQVCGLLGIRLKSLYRLHGSKKNSFNSEVPKSISLGKCWIGT